MLSQGSSWTVAVDDFAAAAIGGHNQAEPIEKGSVLVILDPVSLPDNPSSAPRVHFSNTTGGKKFWAFERDFKNACEPRR